MLRPRAPSLSRILLTLVHDRKDIELRRIDDPIDGVVGKADDRQLPRAGDPAGAAEQREALQIGYRL